MTRSVTERDLRAPEFRDGDPDDYEFRDDGKIVRKDRWEIGLRNIVSILGWSRREFEVKDVVEEVRRIVDERDFAQNIDFLSLVDELVLSWSTDAGRAAQQRRIKARADLEAAIREAIGLSEDKANEL